MKGISLPFGEKEYVFSDKKEFGDVLFKAMVELKCAEVNVEVANSILNNDERNTENDTLAIEHIVIPNIRYANEHITKAFELLDDLQTKLIRA